MLHEPHGLQQISLPLSMEAVLKPQQGTVTLPGVLFPDPSHVEFYLVQQSSTCGL